MDESTDDRRPIDDESLLVRMAAIVEAAYLMATRDPVETRLSEDNRLNISCLMSVLIDMACEVKDLNQ